MAYMMVNSKQLFFQDCATNLASTMGGPGVGILLQQPVMVVSDTNNSRDCVSVLFDESNRNASDSNVP